MRRKEAVIVAKREHAARTSAFLFKVVAKRQQAPARISPVALIFGRSAFSDRFRRLRGGQTHGSPNQARSNRNRERRTSEIIRRKKLYKTHACRSSGARSTCDNRANLEWTFGHVILKVVAETSQAKLDSLGKPIMSSFVSRAPDDLLAGPKGIGIKQAIRDSVRYAYAADYRAHRHPSLRIAAQTQTSFRRKCKVSIGVVSVCAVRMQMLRCERIIECFRGA